MKKAPDVALSYLRFAGNLGDIAAQERESIHHNGGLPNGRIGFLIVERERRDQERYVSLCIPPRRILLRSGKKRRGGTEWQLDKDQRIRSV